VAQFELVLLGYVVSVGEMSRKIRLNYIYATAETWERFDLACEQLGWANKSLVQQCVHAFFAKHQGFYAESALKDLAAREMDEHDYYRILRDESEAKLPKYVKGRPGFGVTPLDEVDSLDEGIQRTYNVVTLSNYNSVLLKVARIVDTGPMVQVVSRIVHHHFETYWETNYFPQIERDKKLIFSLKEIR
jgi:hypothetical protein